MDLATGYHNFIKETYPEVIRVADRFHVNKYVIVAVDEVRKRIMSEISPQERFRLKQNKRLLNKRNDSLESNSLKTLEEILEFSSDLRLVYEFKEKIATCYDCSPNYESAVNGFEKICKEYQALNIKEINIALKTLENWKGEILNYHICHFTNGAVEGRNAKIKSLQRRRYFLPNRTFYEALIMLECNTEIYQSLLY